jgi:hypothetical protein
VRRRFRVALVLPLAVALLAASVPDAEAAERRAMRTRSALRVGTCRTCSPGTPVQPPSLVGTYDVEIDGSEGKFLGEIREESGRLRLSVVLDLFSSFQLDVTSGTDGELLLDGYLISGGDFLLLREGEARSSRTTRGTTIAGVLRDSAGTETEIVLTRPTAGVPARLAGRYEIALCDGLCEGGEILATRTFDLRVNADGRASMSAGTLASADGDPLGEVGRLDCKVSPGGAISCLGPYEPEAPPPPSQEGFPQALRLSGRIGPDGEAAGAFGLGVILPPVVRGVFGEWAAVEVGAP